MRRNSGTPSLAGHGCHVSRQGMRREAALRDNHPPVLGAQARRHQIPSLRKQRFLGRHRGRLCAAEIHGKFEGAGLVQKEFEPCARQGIAPREDRLRSVARHRRPDRREHREGRKSSERRVVFDDTVRTGVKGLETSLERTSKVQIDSVLAIARTLRINISLNDADQFGFVAVQPLTAHLNLYRFAGSPAQPVGVGQNPHSRIPHCCPALPSITGLQPASRGSCGIGPQVRCIGR